MPRVKRPYRTVTSPRTGKRPTLLYVRYRDMRQRCKGRATKNPEIYAGLACDFSTFAEFREFALARGFSKRYNSPDRADSSFGYLRWNIRFREPFSNTFAPLAAINAKRRNVTHVAYYDDVPF